MKNFLTICFAILVCFSFSVFAQIPVNILVQISKAEDELHFDKTLEDLIKNVDAIIRTRAVLAAGRIGKETAIPALTKVLENDSDISTRATAAFALGEIESIKGADAILKILENTKNADEIRSRAVEAAGKIGAVNSKDEKAKTLGKAILDVLQFENNRGKQRNRKIVLLGLTAALRAKPEESGFVVAKFLTDTDARIRADAANTLSRLRAKNANPQIRAMLLSDADAVARANAARALGAAEDKEAFNILLDAATTDEDSRVRVSAIRSLGNLKDAKAADRLLMRGENLLLSYKKSKFANPVEKNELLEIATTLGRILPYTNNERAIKFLREFREMDGLKSPETEIAFARIAPQIYIKKENRLPSDAKVNANQWQFISSLTQGLGEIGNLEAKDEYKSVKEEAEKLEADFLKESNVEKSEAYILALPDALRAYALFKPDGLDKVLREHLKHKDVIVRATAVELLGELPPEKIKLGDFEESYFRTREDTKLNDALLATIEAVGKQKTERATNFLKHILYTTSDYLARRRIVVLLKETGAGDFSARLGRVNSIFTQADYIRAVSRKNAKAILTTEKGTFTIEFSPADAPLTIDNFIKLAKSGYFNNIAIHRVVPNFVMQDGDPRGDGNGGPGWQIRDEINMLEYERGAVGMALSGKDTGGSQWFVTHSPQPHLDGGYTVFGRVNETDMKIVDNLVRGDKILRVKIAEGNLPQKSAKKNK